MVIVKDREIIFESKAKGIKDLVLAIEKLGNKLENSSLADVIVGKAVAALCIYAKIKAVFGETISKPAIKTLKEKGIHVEYENKVEKILNREKRDICPFEKIALKTKSPKETYQKIKKILTN